MNNTNVSFYIQFTKYKGLMRMVQGWFGLQFFSKICQHWNEVMIIQQMANTVIKKWTLKSLIFIFIFNMIHA
jgi:hypothetical protein